MNNNFHPHRSPDIFRVILVLTGILLSIAIIIKQLAAINISIGLILISLSIAVVGTIISAVIAKNIAVRIGKEPFAKIFISFSYSDSKFVDKLTYELAQRGFELLRADKAVLVGDIVNEKITDLLFKADFIIVVISNKSLQSPSVLNEVKFFKERQRTIFPILIEKTQQTESEDLSDLISDIQFVNFINNFNEGLKKLIYSLEENAARLNTKEGRNNQ